MWGIKAYKMINYTTHVYFEFFEILTHDPQFWGHPVCL